MDSDLVYETIEDVSIASTAIPLLIGIVRFKYTNTGARAIVLLLILSVVVDVLIGIYQNKAWFSLYPIRLYTLAEFIAFTIFFISLTNRRAFRLIMSWMIVPFLAVCIIDLAIFGVGKRDDLAVSTEAVIIITYSITTFYFMLKDAEHQNILRTPQFWIISAAMIYFGGNTFVFAFHNLADDEAKQILWSGMHSLIAMLYNTFLAIGLWKAKESR